MQINFSNATQKQRDSMCYTVSDTCVILVHPVAKIIVMLPNGDPKFVYAS